MLAAQQKKMGFTLSARKGAAARRPAKKNGVYEVELSALHVERGLSARFDVRPSAPPRYLGFGHKPNLGTRAP
jgi:hypothetical protein